LERSREENLSAIQAHFQVQKNRYGKQVLVSLVEQHGREAIIGVAYRDYVKEMADVQVQLEEFDVHQGMLLLCLF
jgi:hypothetical protein